MLRTTSRVLVVVAALFVTLLALGAAGASASCQAGVRNVGGVNTNTFCGPATMTATIAGKKVTLRGGQCARTSSDFSINIGTIVLGITKKKKPDYFGLTVGSTSGGPRAGHDGTYTKAAIAFDVNGKGYALTKSQKLTLKSGRKKGTFSGISLLGERVSGSFTC